MTAYLFGETFDPGHAGLPGQDHEFNPPNRSRRQFGPRQIERDARVRGNAERDENHR